MALQGRDEGVISGSRAADDMSKGHSPLALTDLVHEKLLNGVGGLLHSRGQNVDIALTQSLDLLQQLNVTKGHCVLVVFVGSTM